MAKQFEFCGATVEVPDEDGQCVIEQIMVDFFPPEWALI